MSTRSKATTRYAAGAIIVSILSLNAFAGIAEGHLSSPADLATIRGIVPIHENFGGQDNCVQGNDGDDTLIEIWDASGNRVLQRFKGDGGPFTVFWPTIHQVPNGYYRVISYGADTSSSFVGCSVQGYRFLSSIQVLVENRAFLVEAAAGHAYVGESVAAQVRVTLEGGHPAVGGLPIQFCPDWGTCVTASTDGSGVALASLPESASVGTRSLTIRYPGNAYFKEASTVLAVTIHPRPTLITYEGASSGSKGTGASFAAVLRDATPGSISEGIPVSSKEVRFTFGNLGAGAVSDAQGLAAVTAMIVDDPATYTLTASFAGDATYAPASVTTDFTVVWPHTFVDDGGKGTVHVNPVTREFQALTPESDSGIVHDPAMVVQWTPRKPACEDPLDCGNPLADSCFDGLAESCRPGLVQIVHVGEGFALAGTFELDSGRFAALAASPSPFLLASTGEVDA